MTVGIACAGPWAGRACLRALRAAEACGEGSIGGFVSLVAIADGRVLRAEVQRSGLAALFPAGAPPALEAATRCGLITSGPDRGEPLARFTPADPAVGLVTGHRMPDVPGRDGVPLNLAVLERMRRGASPRAALRQVLAANGDRDAGLIALSLDGRLHAADTLAAVRPDSGRAVRRAGQGSALRAAAVLHNAVEPHGPLAAMLAEVALRAMRPPDATPHLWAMLRAGTPLASAPAPGLEVDGAGVVRRLLVSDAGLLHGPVRFGSGYATAVLRDGHVVGRAAHEPYLVARDGVLLSADGQGELRIPFSATEPPG